MENLVSSKRIYQKLLSSFQNMNNSAFDLDQRKQMFQSLDLTLLPSRARRGIVTTREYHNYTQDLDVRQSFRIPTKCLDIQHLKKDSKYINDQKVKAESANIRGFLRHTTYTPKVSNFFQDCKNDDVTYRQAPSSALPSTFMKKIQSQNNQNISNCEVYQSNSNNIQKSSINDIENIASKVKRTASYIEELKKLRRSKKKFSHNDTQNEEDTNVSSFSTKILDTPIQNNKSHEPPKFEQDLGFRRRIYQNYYTPKPETQATGQINENIQKMKRGYTPTLKKTISPSHKKILDKPRIEDFIMDKKLGGGKFGTVYRAYHCKTCTVFALKKIEKKIIQQNMLIDQFIQECKIQSIMRHQNIMELYGIFEDKDNIYMILELMEDGNLYSQLKKKGKFCEKEAAVVIKQISKGIVYMHDLGIAHRDLKPENIVISNEIYKICDFGWAAMCQDRRKTCCGTFDYTAPEILEGGQYDMAVDYWGLGVIAYELMVGKPPFYHFSKRISKDNALNVQSKKLNFPEHLSAIAISFIQSLLRKDPSKRLNYHKILHHPFLIDVKTEDF